MKVLIVGLVITFLWFLGLANGLYSEPGRSVPSVLLYMTGGAWVVAVIGAVMIGLGKRRAGSIVVIIGSIVFIPLGLITIFGARKAASGAEEPSLQQRRQMAAAVSADNAKSQ
ncbi:hypothetical protein [Salinicola avicenniae]|uniref:hypothetical protein n=1 Tax=Salinicola avicenniae TaxID=2916836 RepID=UPI00207411E9|nr:MULTISPECIES: hypothetical protein [unclassified Salinicola]